MNQITLGLSWLWKQYRFYVCSLFFLLAYTVQLSIAFNTTNKSYYFVTFFTSGIFIWIFSVFLKKTLFWDECGNNDIEKIENELEKAQITAVLTLLGLCLCASIRIGTNDCWKMTFGILLVLIMKWIDEADLDFAKIRNKIKKQFLSSAEDGLLTNVSFYCFLSTLVVMFYSALASGF